MRLGFWFSITMYAHYALLGCWRQLKGVQSRGFHWSSGIDAAPPSHALCLRAFLGRGGGGSAQRRGWPDSTISIPDVSCPLQLAIPHVSASFASPPNAFKETPIAITSAKANPTLARRSWEEGSPVCFPLVSVWFARLARFTPSRRGEEKVYRLPCTFCVPRYPRVTRMRGAWQEPGDSSSQQMSDFCGIGSSRWARY